MTGTDVVTTAEAVHYAGAGIDSRWDYAKRVAAADDLLPKGLRGIIRGPDGTAVQGVVPGKAFLILETGRMLGVDPMAALQGINVIEGAASIAPSLMQALVRRAGHRLRVDVTGTVAGGDIAATATLTRADEPDEPYVVTWTVDDAIAADLVSKYEPGADGKWVVTARSKDNNKLNWEKYTRQMLKWRAQSEVVRDGAEDVLLGVHYSPDELGAIVTEEGEITGHTLDEFTAAEDAAIAKIRAITDRAQAQAVVDEIRDDVTVSLVWSPRVESEFAAHMLTVTVDSRPPRDGAPGHTGDPDVDEQPEPVVDERIGEIIEDAVVVTDEPTEELSPEEQLKRDADAADERARLEYEAEQRKLAEPDVLPGQAAPLDMSALEGKRDPKP